MWLRQQELERENAVLRSVLGGSIVSPPVAAELLATGAQEPVVDPALEQLGVGEPMSLEQAAGIIQAAFQTDEPTTWTETDPLPTDDTSPPPNQLTTPVLIRLLSAHKFRHPTDLACPIFQALVFTFTHQGALVVPVRGGNGSAMSAEELWERMNRGSEVRTFQDG